ncbi:MAG TPA: TetR/AcrR family transcriptional regulator [Deltaproteobacteria bacterium]|nr:TetR/AcrR family transcriptional regulator [Deltaproteobacteria bacterium]HQJ08315.1 TetR/AcrR family transcriptional regulator [Deltaproteobacteria bacterium]
MRLQQRAYPVSRRSRRRTDVREEIIKAARELFAKKGYHKTQVMDLIAHVGMSTNTFYAHFKDKKELFEEVAVRSMEDLRETLRKTRETKFHGDLHDRLDRIEDTYNLFFDFMDEKPLEALVIIRGAFGVDEEMDRDIWRHFSSFAYDLADDFRKWTDLGMVEGFDPLILGHIVQGMTIQVAHSYLVEKRFTRQEAITTLIAVNRAIFSQYLTDKGWRSVGIL